MKKMLFLAAIALSTSVAIAQQPSTKKINGAGVLNTIGTLAPVAYNLAQGLQKPKQENVNDY